MMLPIEDIKKKRETYERKIEEILVQFEKELPSEVRIDSSVAVRNSGVDSLKCRIKLVVEDLNKW